MRATWCSSSVRPGRWGSWRCRARACSALVESWRLDVGPEALERAKRLGADAVVSLESEDLVAAFKEACGGDGPTLVIDPVWGEPAVAAATAAAPGARLVNIGQSAGPAAPFLSADVRGKQLNILGFSNFGTPREVMHREYLRLLEYARAGEIEVETKTFSFEQVAEAWEAQAEGAGAKVVVTL